MHRADLEVNISRRGCVRDRNQLMIAHIADIKDQARCERATAARSAHGVALAQCEHAIDKIECAHMKHGSLPEGENAEAERLAVCARVAHERGEVAAGAVEEGEEEDGQAGEDDIVHGRRDAINERLAGEAVVKLEVEEHARKARVLVERVRDQTAEPIS
jgi:hypothetical protein